MLLLLLMFLAMLASMAVESRKFWARAMRSPVDSGNRGAESGKNGFKPVVFRADEEARVVVLGHGDARLDFSVYNANGDLIDLDICTFDPPAQVRKHSWAANFPIQVGNLAVVYNQYRGWSN